MSNQINIFNLYVNGMAQNANINIGRTLQNSHTANMKIFGANFSMGDYSPVSSVIIMGIQATGISEQGQTENPSSSS
jgi:hypothetical protein